mmetsp:Transcript_42654/g.103161  ORF Transcript_42654/g.103161 Transcript_42654/m.103161 type:complete len:450 (+) Transcript_42654:151-1500(+)
MNHISRFAIVAIFLIALATVVGNEALVSSVSKLLRDAESSENDFATTASQQQQQQQQPKVPKCLVNLHIPKVGGRTVGTFLQQVVNLTGFEKYPLYGHPGEQALEDIVQAKRSLINERLQNSTTTTDNNQEDATRSHVFENFLVQGHFSARIFEIYPELKECLVMTVLRQPVDRAISAFFFHNHKRYQIDSCLSWKNYNQRDNEATTAAAAAAAANGNRQLEDDESSRAGLVIQRGNATILMSQQEDDTAMKRAAMGAKGRLVRARMDARKNNHGGGAVQRRCKLFWQYSNDMTLRFAGLPELPWKTWEMSEKGRKFRKDYRNQELERARLQKKKLSVSSIPRVNESHLARAKENMKNYMGLVCFLHDLPSCAERILQAFQLSATTTTDDDENENKIDVSMMTTNKTTKFKTQSRPDQLEEEELQKFQEANRFDQALYDWALEEYHSSS